MRTPTVQTASFVVLIIIVTAAFIWLMLPFYGAVLWAVILALLFNPLQRRLAASLGGRDNIAAGLSLLACVCIVVIPGSIILAALAQEATDLYYRTSTREFDLAKVLGQVRSAMPPFVVETLSALNLGSFEEIQARLTSLIGQAAQVIATRAVSIGQGTAQFFISLGVMLYVLFFLFRDGATLATTIRNASPLSEHHTDYILGKFSDVIRATVKGNVIIAVIQGGIGGVAFWLLGIEAALLWGALMTMLSLLPAIGAFLVWGPAAAYLFLSGQYLRGAILVAVGVFIISLIDNLLRPPLVGKRTRLPDYVILVATLGGIALFGVNGFVIGPLIAALFVAVWSLFTRDRTKSGRSRGDTLG